LPYNGHTPYGCRARGVTIALVHLAGALNALGDAAAWSTDKLLAPILTGVFVGLALRAAAIPGEINAHNARAEELNTDLARWLPDREIVLIAQVSEARNLAQWGKFAESTTPPIPPELVGSQPGSQVPPELVGSQPGSQVPPELVGSQPGSQVDSGAFKGEIVRLMREALHDYRDRASGAVREYRAMAQSEGRVHRLLRRCRSRDEPSPLRLTAHGQSEGRVHRLRRRCRSRDEPSPLRLTAHGQSEGRVHRLRRRCRSRDEPSPLRLTAHGHDVLASWRERQIPDHARTTVSVVDDPTRQEDAAEIRPLEEESGLAWTAGRLRQRGTVVDAQAPRRR